MPLPDRLTVLFWPFVDEICSCADFAPLDSGANSSSSVTDPPAEMVVAGAAVITKEAGSFPPSEMPAISSASVPLLPI